MPLTAKTILADFRTGSSLPAHVEASDGAEYVVKWKCTGEGPLTNATDWLCLRLARLCGILVPTPSLIVVKPELATQTNNGELRDLIMRSLGVNLGVQYIGHALPYNARRAHEIDDATKELIFLFDVLFLNIDRTDHNPNMIVSEHHLYCIDFAAAMSLKMLMSGEQYSEHTLLPLIRRHPFYSDRTNFELPNLTASAETITEIVEAIPNEWLANADATRQRLIAGVTTILLTSRMILKRRLSLLNTLKLESPESIQERTRDNRIAFEQKWGKL